MRIKQIKKTVMNVYIHHSFFINLFCRAPENPKDFQGWIFIAINMVKNYKNLICKGEKIKNPRSNTCRHKMAGIPYTKYQCLVL